jgi:glycosyltransferase involved in cell wall biosynthesis
MPEIVREGMTGFIVEPSSSRAIAAVLAKLRDDPSIASSMGLAAREEVLNRFTWDAIARQCLTEYARDA